VIHTSVDGDVAVIELDRPERRNALDTAQCLRIAEAIRVLPDDGARAVVITGRGSSFCSGADFGEVHSEGFRAALTDMLIAVDTAPVPVIAAVNGPAIGGGTQLAIAADLRVAAPEAAFMVPTARLGLAVDPWTIRRLAQLAGGGTARAMLIGCDTIDARLAHTRGLVDRLGTLEDAAAWAADLATAAPLTLRYNALTLDREDLPVDHPELLAAFEGCWLSEDRFEGERARAQKRPPVFQGR